MQLVLITHRGRTTFEIRHISLIIGNDERTLKLSGIAGIDTEITAQFHRTAHALGDIYKRTVGEDGTIQGCIEIIAIWNNGAQILAHQIGMFFHGFSDTHEDNAHFTELLLEGGLHRHGVHDGIYGHTTQCQTLF